MISDNIRYLRKKFGYSQEELADKIDVSRQSVAKWENGECLPDILKCNELAEIFGTNIDCLINYSFLKDEYAESSFEDRFVFGMVKVGERGQIVIPKHAREVFKIEPGDRLIVVGDLEKGLGLGKINGLSSFKFHG